MFLVSRSLEFLSNVFLYPKEEMVFEELFIDKNDHYKADIADWSLDGTFVALSYNENLKRELGAYKYLWQKNKKQIFLPYLKKCFDLFIAENIDETAIITGAPLFIFSRIKRGYNQSALLASEIAKASGLAHKGLLRKIRWTRHQAKLDRYARLSNLENAFSVSKKYHTSITWKDIIFVDDIISTGSTANECAKALKVAGARKVYGLFLATGD